MNKLRTIAFTVSMTLLAQTSADAQVKKWVDKDGKVHYGDAISAPVKSDEVKINDNRGSFKTEVNLPQTTTKNNAAQKNEQNTEVKE